ncbi:ankyrin [Daldinia bambusicola]|nr:ankyrin [Daldinia bambusicola]
MSGLVDLPVEILQMIAAAEEPSSPILLVNDLANLSLVSRGIHCATNHSLYIDKDKTRLNKALRYAVRHGNFDTLNVITSLRTDVELSYDLLVLACQEGQRDMALWLLERGAPVDGDEWHWHGYYDLKLWTEMGRLSHNAPKGFPALLCSINSNMEDIALRLLYLGANTGADGQSPYFRSALHYAAGRNMIQTVDYLVQELGMPVDILDHEGYTPLRFAMRYLKEPDKDTRMVERLLELGADVNSEADGELPLTSALRRKRFRHAIILLDAGSKIKPEQPQILVLDPLRALIHGRYNGKIPFRSSMQRSILRRLVEGGADLIETGIFETTPLEDAITNGSPQMTHDILNLIAKKFGKGVICLPELLSFMIRNMPGVPFFIEKAEVIFKAEMLFEGGCRMDKDLGCGWAFLDWILRHGKAYHLKRMLKIANKSTLDRKYLDVLLEQILTHTLWFYYVDERYVSVLASKGAKVEPKLLISVLFRLVHEKTTGHRELLAALLDLGFPTRLLPRLLTSALEKKAESRFVDLLLDRIEPHVWRHHRKWLYASIRRGYDEIVGRLLKETWRGGINSVAGGRTLLFKALEDVKRHSTSFTVTSVLIKHGADPFLPTRQCVCHRKKHETASYECEPMSAFELVVHKGAVNSAKAMWGSVAPELRPDPKTFFECTNISAKMKQWLEDPVTEDATEEVTEDITEEGGEADWSEVDWSEIIQSENVAVERWTDVWS